MVFRDKLRKRSRKGQSVKVLNKRDVYDVIKGVVMSEKSYQSQKNGKYIFWVDYEANKNDVKKAVEVIYGVRPEKVNIIILPSKLRTGYGKRIVRKKAKKAIVTLPKGKTIEVGL